MFSFDRQPQRIIVDKLMNKDIPDLFNDEYYKYLMWIVYMLVLRVKVV